ncbi:MAG: HAD hydrolase-like protein [Deltaproteobacteria bacterium]|nr:HAD hydrolase-like protein [Deltaproteobacteria bacterium]
MKSITGLLIDLDGVLVKGKAMNPFPDAAEFMTFLRRRGIAFRIVTNNSMKPLSWIAGHLQENNILVFEEEIVSPMAICPRILKDQKREKVFVMGSEDLKQHLASLGFSIKTDAAVDAVLVAQDRTLHFEEIKTAITAIKKYGAELFAMNDNRIILDDDGMPFAGAGAICRLLIYATDYRDHFVHFGKMGEIYNQTLFEQFHQDKGTLALISDDLYTDIKGYQAEGLMGIFLTTGKYGKEDVAGDMKPDVILDSLTEVVAFLKCSNAAQEASG